MTEISALVPQTSLVASRNVCCFLRLRWVLKEEGRFYPGYSIVIYDMIIKCGNKTERKQTRTGSTPTYSLDGRVDEQSLTFRDLEKSGGLKQW